MRLIGDTRKSKNIPSKRKSRESVESPSIPHVINYSPARRRRRLLPSLPFGIVMISLRARKSANFIQEMITFTSRQQTRTRRGEGAEGKLRAAPGYKPAISIFRTLDLCKRERTDSSPTNAVQSARDRSSITSTGTTSKLRACEPRIKTSPGRDLRLAARKRYSWHCAVETARQRGFVTQNIHAAVRKLNVREFSRGELGKIVRRRNPYDATREIVGNLIR